VIDDAVEPSDHTNPLPDAERTELPQLLETVTTGVDGNAVGDNAIVAHVSAPSFTHPAPSSPLTKYVCVVAEGIENVDPAVVPTSVPPQEPE